MSLILFASTIFACDGRAPGADLAEPDDCVQIAPPILRVQVSTGTAQLLTVEVSPAECASTPELFCSRYETRPAGRSTYLCAEAPSDSLGLAATALEVGGKL